MGIADPHNKMVSNFSIKRAASWLNAGLLLCFVLILPVFSRSNPEIKEINQARSEFNNGNYAKAVDLAETAINKAQNLNNATLILNGLEIAASAQISSEKYQEAEATLNKAIEISLTNKVSIRQKAQLNILFAWLWRSQRKNEKAFEFGKKALAIAPNDQQILGEYYLNIGRIFFSSGYDIAAIIWLEKAEIAFETEKANSSKLDVLRFLSLTWKSKSNHQKALEYAEKNAEISRGTEFKYKHRQSLYQWGNLLSAVGQTAKALSVYKNGLDLALREENTYQARNLLSVIAFNCLYDNKINLANNYLEQLERLDSDKRFAFDVLLGKAVVAAFEGRKEESERLFAELDKMEADSPFNVPLWKITVAEKQKDWERLIELNQYVLDLTLKENFRDDLPNLYFNFANAYFNLGQTQKSVENLEKSIALVEEIRSSENSNLSLGLFETYHNAYRLLTQIKLANPKAGLELADFLKARLLKDRIDNSPIRKTIILPETIRKRLEEISMKYFDDQSLAAEIEKNEKLISIKIPELDLRKTDFSELDKIAEFENSAIVSYFFTLNKKLLAFVWEKGKVVQSVELSISEDELERLADKTHQTIKDRVFFKRDGKAIYDKLLKPLSLTSNHLIIIPDKSLWKIPFQALSSDGEKYLIEEKLISYAPSVTVLIDQLKNPKPNRQALQAFANSTFENKVLQYVNTEVSTVSGIYGSKPLINATVNDFTKRSESADILHFSMHAEVDNEEPLDSFLGFKKIGNDDGRLTVEELLNIKLKKGSLVFLASCDTNNVFSGEGLVSLAWGMIGSGATTVISAGWEANDKSTAIFTKTFYENYKRGSSSAEAIQKAALELIRNKSNNMHEPYYWADFAINGDFR